VIAGGGVVDDDGGSGRVDLLVVAAMIEEIEPLRPVLASPSVALAVTGDGALQAREGVRALLALDFDALLVGDGASILAGGKDAIRRALERP
jgi:hypothetical protein